MIDHNKMPLNLSDVQSVVSKMENTFDTHDFIEVYKTDFPDNYDHYVKRYRGNIVTAHSQLAKFLKRNSDALCIKHVADILSINMYGRKTSCAKWEKQSLR